MEHMRRLALILVLAACDSEGAGSDGMEPAPLSGEECDNAERQCDPSVSPELRCVTEGGERCWAGFPGECSGVCYAKDDASAPCLSDEERCDGVCVRTSSDYEHCGECGNACPVPVGGGAACFDGVCCMWDDATGESTCPEP